MWGAEERTPKRQHIHFHQSSVKVQSSPSDDFDDGKEAEWLLDDDDDLDDNFAYDGHDSREDAGANASDRLPVFEDVSLFSHFSQGVHL